MSKYCRNCGNEVDENAAVCLKCGHMITDGNDVSQHSSKNHISIVLGILGIGLTWILAILGHIASIAGIIVGAKEYKETGKMAGLILSVIGEFLAIFSSILGVIMVMY